MKAEAIFVIFSGKELENFEPCNCKENCLVGIECWHFLIVTMYLIIKNKHMTSK